MNVKQRTLLEKFLNGSYNRRELQEAKALLNEPGAKEFMQELMGEQADQVEIDFRSRGKDLEKKTEIWLNQIHQQISKNEEIPKTHKIQPIKWGFLRYAAVWAGVIMVASIAFWQIKTAKTNVELVAYVEKANAMGVPVKFILPDSSSVFLGAGSKLRYPIDFKGDVREIKLDGEAFFQVKHMSSKPFIIRTGDIQTQVLGTSFKVQAFEGQPLMVAVATGKVGVTKSDNKESKLIAMLTPGLKVTYYAKSGKAVNGTVDINSLAQWKDGEIVFDEQPLEQVTSELERRFGVNIAFVDETQKEYKVSGSFSSDQSISTAMKMLSIIGKFEYKTQTNKSFIIDKPDNM